MPEVLLSGHHQRIEEWRRQEALRRTYLNRPDLLEMAKLTEEEKKWLESLSAH